MMKKPIPLILVVLMLVSLNSSCVRNVKPVSGTVEPGGKKEEQMVRSDFFREEGLTSEEESTTEFSEGIGDIRDEEIVEEGIRVEDLQEGQINDGSTKDHASVVLVDVFFEYDRAVLKSDAEEVLRENARNLLLNPAVNIRISGHTDERGSNEYNLALGARRARRVKRFLVASGVESSQIEIISFGEEKPFCTESEKHCWKRNRRAHFMVKPEG